MRNWEVWKTNIEKSNNYRMLQQLAFHTQQTIQTTSAQDLDPRPCTDNVHTTPSPRNDVLWTRWKSYSCDYPWKPLVYLSHIKRRTNDDCFPLPLWETWFCLRVPIPVLIGRGPKPPVTLFNMIHFGTIWRHAKLNQRLYSLTTGVFINSVHYSVLWVTKWRSRIDYGFHNGTC